MLFLRSGEERHGANKGLYRYRLGFRKLMRRTSRRLGLADLIAIATKYLRSAGVRQLIWDLPSIMPPSA